MLVHLLSSIPMIPVFSFSPYSSLFYDVLFYSNLFYSYINPISISRSIGRWMMQRNIKIWCPKTEDEVDPLDPSLPHVGNLVLLIILLVHKLVIFMPKSSWSSFGKQKLAMFKFNLLNLGLIIIFSLRNLVIWGYSPIFLDNPLHILNFVSYIAFLHPHDIQFLMLKATCLTIRPRCLLAHSPFLMVIPLFFQNFIYHVIHIYIYVTYTNIINIIAIVYSIHST